MSTQPNEGGPPVTLTSPKRTYALRSLLAVGETADVHLGDAIAPGATDTSYVLKVSRITEGLDLLDNERKVLAKLLTAAGETTYRKYLPTICESFVVGGKFPRRVNVFLHEPGYYTLEQVHERHPTLDGRHLAWIFKRLLTVLGFCHTQGIVHGAVFPCHVLVQPEQHGLQLVGWGSSVETDQTIHTLSERYRSWYPREVQKKKATVAATDLNLAARCLVYLAGGDPEQAQMPAGVPDAMRRFIDTCLLEGAAMRPDNAWKLHEEFDELLRRLYGPPKFHILTMS